MIYGFFYYSTMLSAVVTSEELQEQIMTCIKVLSKEAVMKLDKWLYRVLIKLILHAALCLGSE